MYYWEEDPQGTCTKVYPYGVELSWSGGWCGDILYKGFRSLYQRQNKEDIEFRGAGLESFSRYRLWIMPMQVHGQKMHANDLHKSLYGETDLSCFANKKSSNLSLYVAYADWPYEVRKIHNDTLVFDHEQSDFSLTLEIPNIKQKDWVSRPGEVVFNNKQSNAADQKSYNLVHLVRMRYTYKDAAKRAKFKQNKQNRDAQKLRDEQAKKDVAAVEQQNRMGFGAQGNSQLQQQSHYRKIASHFVTILQNNTLKIFGGFTFSAVVVGAMWYLYKYRIPGLNSPNPNKTVQISYPT